MYDLLKEFIKPELLILVPVLNIVGLAIKKKSPVADKNIPWILGAAGVVLSYLCLLYTSAEGRHNKGLYGDRKGSGGEPAGD